MIARRNWFDRKFELGLPPENLPEIVERLRGTPARIEERIKDIRRDLLTRRVGPEWSIQENIGHLLDLEPLWYVRMDELRSGAGVLTAADLQNTKTHEARHNERTISDILQELRKARLDIVQKLEGMNEHELRRSALHPRLKQLMNVVDLAFFVAEHDDHHLATISGILRTVRSEHSRE